MHAVVDLCTVGNSYYSMIMSEFLASESVSLEPDHARSTMQWTEGSSSGRVGRLMDRASRSRREHIHGTGLREATHKAGRQVTHANGNTGTAREPPHNCATDCARSPLTNLATAGNDGRAATERDWSAGQVVL